MMKSHRVLAFAAFLIFFLGGRAVSGQTVEPGWDWRVIGSRDFREQIQQTPIELRPYRPFHFYGNTVRREHYRGTAMPVPRNRSRTPATVIPFQPRGAATNGIRSSRR